MAEQVNPLKLLRKVCTSAAYERAYNVLMVYPERASEILQQTLLTYRMKGEKITEGEMKEILKKVSRKYSSGGRILRREK